MKKVLFAFVFFLNISGVLADDSQNKKLEALWYYTETPRSRESLKKHISKIGILAPQTYVLGMNGEVTSNMKTDVLDFAQKNHVKVMPLLANTNGKVFSQKAVDNLLVNSANWEKVAKYMREEAAKYSYYGWQMDLENIPAEHGEQFTQFIKYLKTQFAKDNLVLSIAVVARVSDNNNDYTQAFWENWAGAYDYKALSENSDFITVMAYDQSDSTGPVATLGWQKRVLDYSLKNIPAEKISFGIPVYGWAYRKGEKKHFVMIDYPFTYTKLSNFNKKDSKNMTTGAGQSKYWGNISWVSYNQYGKNYTIWYEDKNSFKAKYDQIKNTGVRGYSVWVLGDEDPEIWNLNL